MSATILFADDSDSIRMIIKGILQSEGYRTIECGDGQEAIDYLKEHRVDVIVSDLNMPGASGVDVAHHVRAEASLNRFTPMVMLTTEKSVDMKKVGRDAGVTAWIEKPFEPDSLQVVVKRCLGGRHK